MDKSNETFCVTDREILDAIEVYSDDGKKILEVVVISISKNKVKLGFRGSKTIKYALLRAIDDGVH